MSEQPAGEIVLYQRGHAAAFDVRLAEQPSEVEGASLETVKTVQKQITGKRKP